MPDTKRKRRYKFRPGDRVLLGSGTPHTFDDGLVLGLAGEYDDGDWEVWRGSRDYGNSVVRYERELELIDD